MWVVGLAGERTPWKFTTTLLSEFFFNSFVASASLTSSEASNSSAIERACSFSKYTSNGSTCQQNSDSPSPVVTENGWTWPSLQEVRKFLLHGYPIKRN
jgi:hypothetical protein